MATAHKNDHGEQWRLGIELDEGHEPTAAPQAAEPERDFSHERLARPIHVVTVEQLCWLLVALYTLATRLFALGARPLDAGEAIHALLAFDLTGNGIHAAAGYRPAFGGWLHLITAIIFGTGGSSDFSARLIYALSGMLLVAMAFEMRHYLGRAGGLALASILATSPAVTFFSRSSAPALAASAIGLVTIALFMALKWRPGNGRAVLLGIAAGLMIAADPTGIVTAAIFLAALILTGLPNLFAGRKLWLGIQVWLDRYSALPVVTLISTAATWALSQSIIPGGFDGERLLRAFSDLVPRAPAHARFEALHFLLPALALYEFLTVIAALLGTLVIISLRIRSRFAAWCLIWTAMSIGYYLQSSSAAPDRIIQMIVPMAMVGAIGLDWLHRSESWRIVRIPLALVALFAIYVGAIANFIAAIPDASEPPWNRHASILWNGEATTAQARLYAGQASAGLTPADATVFFDGATAPALRWYLRDLRPVTEAGVASIYLGGDPHTLADTADTTSYDFDFAEEWRPDFAALDARGTLRYLLAARAWGSVSFRRVTMTAQRAGSSAPTVILIPEN